MASLRKCTDCGEDMGDRYCDCCSAIEAVVLPNRLLNKYGAIRSQPFKKLNRHLDGLMAEVDKMKLNPGELRLMGYLITGDIDCYISERCLRAGMEMRKQEVE